MSKQAKQEEFIPPPRTPEQIAADRVQLERETEAEAERARWKDLGGLPVVLRTKREEGDLDGALAGILTRLEGQDERRRALPCFEASEAGNDDLAVDRCEAVRAFEKCEWSKQHAACPRLRAPDVYADVLARLSAGDVPSDYSDCILEAARRTDRKPLMELDSLVLVRALIRRKRLRVPLENGAEALADGARHAGEVFLTGSERILALIGNQGRGKSLAAAYAIARLGGLYTSAPAWTRRGGVDYDVALAVPVLVVDQLCREDWGSSDWMRSQLEDVVDQRYQRRRLTIFVANVVREALDRHLVEKFNQSTMGDRLRGEAVVVELGGESIRPLLRAQLLREKA